MLQHFSDLRESQQDREREEVTVPIKELPKGKQELPTEEKRGHQEEEQDNDGFLGSPKYKYRHTCYGQRLSNFDGV